MLKRPKRSSIREIGPVQFPDPTHSNAIGGKDLAAYVIYNQTEVLDQEALGEPTFADAILDRIVHNAHRLELDGPSMRKIEADKNRPATIDQAQGK